MQLFGSNIFHLCTQWNQYQFWMFPEKIKSGNLYYEIVFYKLWFLTHPKKIKDWAYLRIHIGVEIPTIANIVETRIDNFRAKHSAPNENDMVSGTIGVLSNKLKNYLNNHMYNTDDTI